MTERDDFFDRLRMNASDSIWSRLCAAAGLDTNGDILPPEPGNAVMTPHQLRNEVVEAFRLSGLDCADWCDEALEELADIAIKIVGSYIALGK